MALLKNDSLNSIYTEYYDVMNISEEQKKERIELAELLDDVFLYLFVIVASSIKAGTYNKEDLVGISERRMRDTLEDFGISFDRYPYMNEYVQTISKDVVESTARNLGVDEDDTEDDNKSNNSEPGKLGFTLTDTNSSNKPESYFTSEDRAIICAETETNRIFNHIEYEDAVSGRFTKKTWLTQNDAKVRPTHRSVDGLTIGIDELFHVGNSYMAYPLDMSHGNVELSEVVNCRCSVKYSTDEVKGDIYD